MEIINSFLVRRHLWSRSGEKERGDKCVCGGGGGECVCVCVHVSGWWDACVCVGGGGEYESVNRIGGGGGELHTI